MALKFGILDVNGMLNSMSWVDYCRWYEHYLKEPWGSVPRDYYLSQLLHVCMIPVIKPGHLPQVKDLIFDLLRKPEVDDDGFISDDELKKRMRSLR